MLLWQPDSSGISSERQSHLSAASSHVSIQPCSMPSTITPPSLNLLCA